MSASRCASRSPARISSRFTTNWATISTSGPIPSCRPASAIAPTMASTKRLATPSRSQITGEDFLTVHHELGHNFYQRAYSKLPPSFRDSANDGFHEAVGDTIALSITPEYLVKIGLLDQAPDTSKDIGLLLHKALEKIAFLPFGLVIDQWRWKVFFGGIPPEKKI